MAQHWASASSEYAAATDPGQHVEALERRYSLRLPEDFRAYLLIASPGEHHSDFQGVQWWPASAIRSFSDECPDWPPGDPEIDRERDRYLIFTDYLIWCYAWAICCLDGPNRGKVAIIGGSPDMFVADSFREFVRLELADDLQIHHGP